MRDKLQIIESSSNWKQREKAWDEKARLHRGNFPLKTLKSMPKMVGITPGTAKFLRLKSLFYLLAHDEKRIFLRYFFKHPLKYTLSLLRSYLSPQNCTRKEDLFFYGLQTEEEFAALLEDPKTVPVVGFSYCQKPLECPSGRFTDLCQNDEGNPVCGQCSVGKCSTLLKGTNAKVLYIPTIHYIGEKIFEFVFENPGRQVVFLITACEMSLRMFGDWGNMVGAKGIGIRLDGRICNTMKAFKLSENGIKPGLTVVTGPTEEKMLTLLSRLGKGVFDGKA